MSAATARLVGLQVGLPRTLGDEGSDDPMEFAWTTGFFKEPVAGPLRLGWTGPEGDGQADLVNHGGRDKAACVYASRWYPAWRDETGRVDVPFGAFGENFTVERMDESSVCIGDTYRLGGAIVQVSQPRQPCWKLNRRWRIGEMAALVVRSGRTGWYFRVIEPGLVSAGDAIEPEERPHPESTIEAANQVMYHMRRDLAAARRLAECSALSDSWRDTLTSRLSKASKTA